MGIGKDIIIIVLKKLLGSTIPYGDHSIDEERIKNLDVAIGVAEWLLDEIECASEFKDRPEASIRAISQKSYEWLESLTENLCEKYGRNQRRNEQ